ncbi:plasmid stabilization protein [Streptomyces sp. NPDC054804]
MPAGSSSKRERQYEHIKESAQDRGESAGRAKEIAARTVNKERARSGESKTASKASTRDPKSSSQRGGQRSHSGAQGQRWAPRPQPCSVPRRAISGFTPRSRTSGRYLSWS